MTSSIGLIVFIGIFALAIGLIGSYIATAGREKRKLLVTHESRHLARQPWDTKSSSGRANR